MRFLTGVFDVLNDVRQNVAVVLLFLYSIIPNLDAIIRVHVLLCQTSMLLLAFRIEGLRAKRAYIEFWPIFIFCRIELIFGRLTCFDMKSIVP